MILTKKRHDALTNLRGLELCIKLFLVITARELYHRDAKVRKRCEECSDYLPPILERLYFVLACKFRKQPQEYKEAVYAIWPIAVDDINIYHQHILMTKLWGMTRFTTKCTSNRLERLQYHLEQDVLRLCDGFLFVEDRTLEKYIDDYQDIDAELLWPTPWASKELCRVYAEKMQPEHFLNKIEMQYENPRLLDVEPLPVEDDDVPCDNLVAVCGGY